MKRGAGRPWEEAALSPGLRWEQGSSVGHGHSHAEVVPQAVGIAVQRPWGRTMLEEQRKEACVCGAE